MKYASVKCNIIIIGIHIEMITLILFTKYIICRMNIGFEVHQRKTKYTYRTELILKPVFIMSFRGNGDTGKLEYEVCLDGKTVINIIDIHYCVILCIKNKNKQNTHTKKKKKNDNTCSIC